MKKFAKAMAIWHLLFDCQSFFHVKFDISTVRFDRGVIAHIILAVKD